MRRKRTGFTVVELLAALGIIALLVGLLIPALSMVRRTAKEVKQKAQFATIEMALLAFKNDYGDYPPSDGALSNDYCGAQKLAEALLGWDLRGFHPKSTWDAGGIAYSDPDLNKRKGPYLDLATTSAFRLRELFYPHSTGSLAPNTFVICDAFRIKKTNMFTGIVDPATGSPITSSEKAGTPILYYRANTSNKTMNPADPLAPGPENQIYNSQHNLALIILGSLPVNGGVRRPHKLGDDDGVLPPYGRYNPTGEFFYNPTYRIIDPRVLAATGKPQPYRPDSYILISAGVDGIYGTSDDICNFGN